MSDERYIPALRFPALTRVYDPLIRWTTRERLFKSRLLEQASPRAAERILDLGCGTGTLAMMAKRAAPGADIAGLDADPEILELARAKSADAGLEIAFDQGLSNALPYPDASFDLVLSSLFFHHLKSPEKQRTGEEIVRVLRPGGRLHVADWGRPADPLMRLLSLQIRLFDGHEPTQDNLNGRLPAILGQAGLAGTRETGRLRTVFGTLAFYRATRSESA